jgi:hypothetical protein
VPSSACSDPLKRCTVIKRLSSTQSEAQVHSTQARQQHQHQPAPLPLFTSMMQLTPQPHTRVQLRRWLQHYRCRRTVQRGRWRHRHTPMATAHYLTPCMHACRAPHGVTVQVATAESHLMCSSRHASCIRGAGSKQQQTDGSASTSAPSLMSHHVINSPYSYCRGVGPSPTVGV